jgi:hypothetical protein
VEAGDSFDPFPPVPVPDRNLDHTERIIAVDGEEQALTVVSYGNYAALRYRQGSVVVTAVARLGFSPALSCLGTLSVRAEHPGARVSVEETLIGRAYQPATAVRRE